ncbi:23S rRNA (adenine(2503)-C(2))-methyltransferase RlmN [Parvibaculum sp.]|uniref:23S rRNA (adenine(2503)-C(2))-methyltransferase RlmN n=1 Tax=Parvibaculum sp. TaxID=2024848 RepID=UPI002730F002|nr:23S rRNA (adenine(2503)-C(2))-methyltransferase RlmN [Parvibaculum sp.]MDP1625541.1 23S rRNA (adenine(2503)-C(2))-methyltransferase RlmN [Parvibaculum sp.]MDP2148090.1 23S rRNA (adenine(2503)-C(2))-methyltransferase RlmN [Parvibaculum sp.]MDP3328293.1 23S rRNA (adenine(2503)-C(2))-methyltransferase RlmN [Parvibaculum sp.]
MASIDIAHERNATATADASARPHLAGLTRPLLMEALKQFGLPDNQLRMRAGQIWNGLYNRGFTDFERMTTLSKELRGKLAEAFDISRLEIVTEQKSVDGTRKWLLRLPSGIPGVPGPEVETVYIPEEGRGTLCVSSQVGCTLTCTFCHTGTQKLVRNLTAGEIVGQILVARDALGEWPDGGRNSEDRLITNIVMMGMGEPLYNFENVRDALEVVSDGEGLSLSKRRITLSTSGVVPMIERAGDEIDCMLAISLHAVDDETRNKLVPLNKKYPIAELLEACRNYPGVSNARRITFEYVMLKGVNDSLEDAKALVRLLKHIPAKINLIPFNPWPGSPYECSDWEQIEKFADVVNRAGYASPVRTPRGRDIMAACGQLKSETVKARASERFKEARADA